MALDWTQGLPAYKQVAEGLRRLIKDQKLGNGAVLPSISAIMTQYDVSITVVRLALDELRDEGLIVTRQGKPALVADPNAKPKETPEVALKRAVEELSAEVHNLGAGLAEVRQELADLRAERERRPTPTGVRRPRRPTPKAAP